MAKKLNNPETEDNLVKKTCRELGITQKELAEMIGVSDSTVRHWSSNNELPEIAKKFITTIFENIELKNKFKRVESFFNLIDDIKGVHNLNTLVNV